MTAYQKLEELFQQQAQLHHLDAMCRWDEATMMPLGGGEARAQALATLKGILHEMLTSPQVREWLVQAQQESLASAWDVANLKRMQEMHQRAQILPIDLVKRSVVAFTRCEQAWRILRQENNWQDFAPLLAENVNLTREIAHISGEALGVDPYDALLDRFSPGVTQKVINPLFSQLQDFLPSFIKQVIEQQPSVAPISGIFSVEKQQALAVELMKVLGFDFNHGRLDVSHHPFCGGVSQDVRITSRYRTDDFICAIMTICHETGHGLYEQGLPLHWLNQPVGQALGMAVHESQSLLIEMQVCRSQEFIQFLTPLVNRYFYPHKPLTSIQLLGLCTEVSPGLIRVDADELCYPLHIILRYEIEKKLISGKLEVKDIPEVWNAQMQHFFNLSIKGNYKNGPMQDVHWAAGLFGYFPAYTLGAIIAAQLFFAIQRQQPKILTKIASGDFISLTAWLRENVHNKGSLLSLNELLQEATGSDLQIDSFIAHLQQRYGTYKSTLSNPLSC